MDANGRSHALRLLVRRLALRSPLGPEDEQALMQLPAEMVPVRASVDFVRAGQRVEHCCLLGAGMAARFEQLEDGRRQIISLHVPGDLVDVYSLMLPQAPTPLQAIGTCAVLRIAHTTLRETLTRRPELSTALWRDIVADGSIVAQSVVNLGRRDARARVAHLLCEMAVRYTLIGAMEGASYAFPITQEQLADVLGLTSVHVNRMLRALREQGLVVVASGRVEILDWRGLKQAGEFDPAYLCLPSGAGELLATG